MVKLGRAFPFYVNGAETLVTMRLGLAAALDRVYREGRFDVVHVHNPFGVMLPITGIRRSPAPVTIGTFHSVVPDDYRLLRMSSRPLGSVLDRLDACVAVSQTVIESVQPSFPSLRFVTVPNGIDTDFFSPSAEPLASLAGKRTVLFVGRFDPRNGVRHAIEAFATLRRRRDDVQLVIVGDGPLRPLVQRLVPAKLREDVVFAGRVNHLRPRYLASAEILCTPCSLASFGMVLLEGMSAGLPVVASRLPGFELVMRDGVDGLMVDRADDASGFAEAIDRLLDDPALRDRMGAAGRQRALTNYAWPVVADQLENLYDDLARRRQPPPRVRRAA